MNPNFKPTDAFINGQRVFFMASSPLPKEMHEALASPFAPQNPANEQLGGNADQWRDLSRQFAELKAAVRTYLADRCTGIDLESRTQQRKKLEEMIK